MLTRHGSRKNRGVRSEYACLRFPDCISRHIHDPSMLLCDALGLAKGVLEAATDLPSATSWQFSWHHFIGLSSVKAFAIEKTEEPRTLPCSVQLRQRVCG